MTKRFNVLLFLFCIGLLACILPVAVYAVTDGGTNYSVPPVITVNYPDGYSEDDIPSAVIGKPYKIFTATAKDIYGADVDVVRKVFAHYDSSKALVGVVNDSFTPNSGGIYTVEFTATDKFGNQSQVLYDFTAINKENLACELSDASAHCKAGETISVANADIVNSIGVTALKIIVANVDGHEQFDVTKTRSFTPMYAGVYNVKYEFSDYNEKGVKIYSVTVDNNPVPIITEEAVLPQYFIVGCEYVLPKITAYHFTDGLPVRITPDISIKEPNGKVINVGYDGKYVPKTEGEIEINYSVSKNDNDVCKTYVAKTVNVGYGDTVDMSKYFAGESGKYTSEILSSGVKISTIYSDSEISFVNPLVAARLTMNFQVLSGGNFDKFDIYLTGSEDSSQKIKLSFERKNESETFFILNDDEKILTDIALTDDENIEFVYSDAKRTVTVGGNNSIAVDYTMEGAPFSGFTGGKTYISFAFENVVGMSSLIVYKLNNQPFYDTDNDRVEPYVVFSKVDSNVLTVGDEFTVSRIYVGDVLDPNYSVIYSVSKPDGQFVRATDGTILDKVNADYTKDYVIKAEMCGLYYVYISVIDSNNNSTIQSYTVSVNDVTPPIITLYPGGNNSGEKGDTIKIRPFSVQDDFTAEPKVVIYVLTPDGNIEPINNEEMSFIPKRAGKYYVFYYSTDNEGNAAYKYYAVMIK